MKITSTLFVSAFGLSAMPLSLAHELPRRLTNSGADSCDTVQTQFTCNPFGPDVCGSIYMTPKLKEKSPLGLPLKVVTLLFDTVTSLAVLPEDPLPLISTLLTLPPYFVGGEEHDTYEVTPTFVAEMEQNVKNYVTTALNTVQLNNLYDDMCGKISDSEDSKEYYNSWFSDKDTPGSGTKWRTAADEFSAVRRSYTNDYYKYEHRTPWEKPNASGGTTGGLNGWGIYYSVYVTQLLIASMQEILFYSTVPGKNPAGPAEQHLVEYAWKGIKHANVLVDMYLQQREDKLQLQGPTRSGNGDISYNISDTWITHQEDPAKVCSWYENNYINYSVDVPPSCPVGHYHPSCGGKVVYRDCSNSVSDFVKLHSIKCAEARKQFVTGAIISNWDTWLIEPSKKWAALADYICENTAYDMTHTRCLNQGEDNDDNYNNGGGTAVDYVSKKNPDDFVLGTFNTNDCPPGTSHVTDKTRCQAAYQSLAAYSPKIGNRVDEVIYWANRRWPTGCFLNRDPNVNTVFFNQASTVGGNEAGTGQPICETHQFVLGTGDVDTNDCPPGTSHITDRDQCALAYQFLVTYNPELSNNVDIVLRPEGGKGRPTGCFRSWIYEYTTFGVFFNHREDTGSSTRYFGSTICETDNKRPTSNIQQSCQRLYPGHNVVATPVSNGPSTQNCNDYYASIQPDSRSKIDFSDNTAHVPGWTCCLDFSPQKICEDKHPRKNVVAVLTNGVSCNKHYYPDKNWHEWNTLSYNDGKPSDWVCCEKMPTKKEQKQCVTKYPEKNVITLKKPKCSGQKWKGTRNCDRKECNSWFKSTSFVDHEYELDGTTGDRMCCVGNDYAPVSNSNTATPMLSLVGSSNEIPQASNMPFSGLLGLIVGLVMVVATYKVVKDHRRHHHYHPPHHPHLKQDNKPDYESLMQA